MSGVGSGVVAATPAQSQAVRAAAAAFYTYAQQVSRAVAARYFYWQSLQQSANTYGITIESVLQAGVSAGAFDQATGARILNDNAAADTRAKQWASVVNALDRGDAELAGRFDNDTIKIGVVVKGTLPRPLEAWPIILGIIVIGIGVGSWLLLDAWADARIIEAEAARVHALTQSAVQQSIAAVAAKYGPDAAKMFADAQAKAMQAAQQPPQGWAANLGQGIGQAINTATGAVADLSNNALVWGLGLYFLSKYL